MTERPSAIDFIKQAGQETRQKENNQRVDRIAELLVNNAGVLGGTIEKEKSDQVCEAVLGVFGAGYKSVEEMGNTLENPSATDRQKEMAKENLGVLGKGIFVAMNRTFANFPGEATETITSQMTKEQIDSVLPDQLKGVGVYVIEADGKATDEEKKKVKEPVGDGGDRRRDGYSPPFVSRDNDQEKEVRSWQISPESAAEAMGNMDRMYWQSYTPPEWMKKLDAETRARIECMIDINMGAVILGEAGRDLERIRENGMYKKFTNERLTKLFNPNFKLALSKMLNDLCELYKDQNGHMCLRYKEGINKDGKPGISEGVLSKLKNIADYKEDLAKFLAEQDKRKEPPYIYRMNAYTAWNLFYMFGDSSVADRRRSLPTYGGIISDALRTLNPEYKALGKWKVSKNDVPESSLEAAEWFGGPLGTYVQTVMQLERDLGKPLDGPMTLREKIISGDLPILKAKTFYGFFDFVAGDRNLYDEYGKNFINKGRKETLASLLMNYAYKDGNFISDEGKREDFSFGNEQVDFLNLYRDQMEAAALTFKAMTGKLDTKDIGGYVSDIRSAFGMVDGISINGNHVYKYTKDWGTWGSMLLGSFGVDMQRLSTNFIYLKVTRPEAYSINIGDFLYRSLGLTEGDVNFNLVKLMRFLGIDIRDGEKYDGLGVSMRTGKRRIEIEKRTNFLYRRIRKK
jgi:hypothetical protein